MRDYENSKHGQREKSRSFRAGRIEPVVRAGSQSRSSEPVVLSQSNFAGGSL